MERPRAVGAGAAAVVVAVDMVGDQAGVVRVEGEEGAAMEEGGVGTEEGTVEVEGEGEAVAMAAVVCPTALVVAVAVEVKVVVVVAATAGSAGRDPLRPALPVTASEARGPGCKHTISIKGFPCVNIVIMLLATVIVVSNRNIVNFMN